MMRRLVQMRRLLVPLHCLQPHLQARPLLLAFAQQGSSLIGRSLCSCEACLELSHCICVRFHGRFQAIVRLPLEDPEALLS